MFLHWQSNRNSEQEFNILINIIWHILHTISVWERRDDENTTLCFVCLTEYCSASNVTGVDTVISKFHKHCANPDSKVQGANMGPTWVLLAPDGPHVGPMNLAIRVYIDSLCFVVVWYYAVLTIPLSIKLTSKTSHSKTMYVVCRINSTYSW